MKFREFFVLLGVYVVTLLRNFVEYLRVIGRYYYKTTFARADLNLIFSYFFHGHFSISKQFLKAKSGGEIKDEDLYVYGETPLTSLELIAKEAQITSKDCVYELGSGRGRVCFWLNSFIGCSVVGVEQIPTFVEIGNRVAQRCGIEGIKFINADICTIDLTGATVCYLYGTCLSDIEIQKLVHQLSFLPRGAKIITVSYSLAEYTDDKWFEMMKHFTIPYTWGTADVYLHIVTG